MDVRLGSFILVLMVFSSIITASFYFDVSSKTEEISVPQFDQTSGYLVMEVTKSGATNVDFDKGFLANPA